MHMSKEVEFKNRDRFIQLGITIAALRKMRGMSRRSWQKRQRSADRISVPSRRRILFAPFHLKYSSILPMLLKWIQATWLTRQCFLIRWSINERTRGSALGRSQGSLKLGCGNERYRKEKDLRKSLLENGQNNGGMVRLMLCQCYCIISSNKNYIIS